VGFVHVTSVDKRGGVVTRALHVVWFRIAAQKNEELTATGGMTEGIAKALALVEKVFG
jgi:hypothetical protein